MGKTIADFNRISRSVMEGTTPTYSFIVPAYNCEKYIGECVESIIKQTLKNWELILVDDGSRDGTADQCDYYAAADFRIRVIHKENGGVVSARMSGVAVARGEYLAFVDSDDWIDVHFLEVMQTALNKSHADIVRCGLYTYKKNSYTYENVTCKGYYDRKKIINEIFPALIQDDVGKSHALGVCGGIIKKFLYKKNEFTDMRVIMGEDTAAMACCIYNAESIYYADEILYYYRYNDSSATKGRRVLPWDGPVNVYNFIESKLDIDTYNLSEQLYRRTAHALFSVIRSRFYADKPVKEIYAEIRENTSGGLYYEVIRRSRFKPTSGLNFMRLAVKYRLYPLIRIYAIR